MNGLSYGKKISNKEAVFYIIKEFISILGIVAGVIFAVLGTFLPVVAVVQLVKGEIIVAFAYLVFGLVFAFMNRFVG